MKKLLLTAVLAAGTFFTASAASATQYWVTNQTALNARSGPGTHYHVIGTFKPCTAVHVVGYSHGWAKVAWNNRYYWVSAKYLRDRACGYAKPRHGGGGYGY